MMDEPAPAFVSYDKLESAATMTGVDYERKILALTALRLLATGLSFQLGSNVKVAGKFDDVVIRVRKESRGPEDAKFSWNVTCVQLKHKDNPDYEIVIRGDKHALLGLAGDYSLVKLNSSYSSMNIQQLCPSGSERDLRCLMYTNAGIVDGCLDEVEVDELLDTGGRAGVFNGEGEVFRGLSDWAAFKEALRDLTAPHGQTNGQKYPLSPQVMAAFQKVRNNDKISLTGNEVTKNHISSLMKKMESVQEGNAMFLTQLLFYVNQANEADLEEKIMAEIYQVIECENMLLLTSIYSQFLIMVKEWHKRVNCCYYLDKNTTSSWLDQAKRNVERMANTRL